MKEEQLQQLNLFDYYKCKVAGLERELVKYKAEKIKWYKKYKELKPGVEEDEDDLDMYMGALSVNDEKDAKKQLKKLQEQYDKLYEEAGYNEAYKMQCEKYEKEIDELKLKYRELKEQNKKIEYNDGDTAPATQEDNWQDVLELPSTQIQEDKLKVKIILEESDDDDVPLAQQTKQQIELSSSQESTDSQISTRPKRTNSKTKK